MLKQGDRVFYTDNNRSLRSEYCKIAKKTIVDLGLIPYYYTGIDLKTEGSSLDTEIRDDFYSAKVVILVLGKDKKWRDIEDNWVIPELPFAIKQGIKFLIYTTNPLIEEEIKRLPVKPFFIEGQEHFKNTLRADLEHLGIEKKPEDSTAF